MKKQQVTIEISIPDGYEFVRWGSPKAGEWFVSLLNGHAVQNIETRFPGHRAVIRKAWQWPEWLKAPYIAMDRNGDWYAFRRLPAYSDKYGIWGNSGGHAALSVCWFFDIELPQDSDAEQSLMKNPHLPESAFE